MCVRFTYTYSAGIDPQPKKEEEEERIQTRYFCRHFWQWFLRDFAYTIYYFSTTQLAQ